VNFSLFSANATKVGVCLFDATGATETGRIELPEFTSGIWHGYVPDIGPGTVYGYRVHGPYAPEEGHRRARVEPGRVRLHRGRGECRPLVRRARERAVHAEVGGRRPELR
jgi:predicted carbohydrate-binding protein with CBM48